MIYIYTRLLRKLSISIVYISRRLNAYFAGAYSLKYGLNRTSCLIGFENLSLAVDSLPTHKSFASSIGCYYQANGGISIGLNTKWGPRVSFISESYHTDDFSSTFKKPIKIGSSVWIGCNVVIMPGVEIADGTVIGSNAVVTRTLSNRPAVIVGIPARILRYL